MPKPHEIDEQVELEREAVRCGVQKLRDNTRRLEEKSYASASIYGTSSINCLMEPLVNHITESLEKRTSKTRGYQFQIMNTYLSDIEPLALGTIGLKLTFDKVFSYKPGSDQLATVAESVGTGVEQEAQMRHYETKAPGLLNVLKENYWHRAIGTQQKLTVIRTLMNRYDVEPWRPWSSSDRVKIGAWLLDCICEVSDWFFKEQRRSGKRLKLYLRPTPEFLAIKDQVMQESEMFSAFAWPMLIPPNDWTTEGKHGGYLLNEVMKGHQMVRKSGHSPIQGKTPVDFLNKIQKVAYRLNPFVVDVAETLQQQGISVGKFLPIIELPLPPKPADIADNAVSRKAYRRAAAEVLNENASAFRRSCRTRLTMEAVERFKDREQFFLPWSLDYRSRAYPIPSLLTPQDTDFGKSLIRFKEESYMTPEAEDWLAFQVSTTYGNDKLPLNERIQWTKDNFTFISRVALDPIGNLSDWEVAEEPWQFLAACDEFYHCVMIADRQFTGLMVAVDATASGLQILSGLCRDASTARLCNVIDSDKPQDAYASVAEAAKPNCPDSVKPYMDRKVTKRSVMTIVYNAKPFSNRQYIRDALKEKGVELSKEDLNETVKAVREAMKITFPGPMAVMKWIEDEITNALKRGLTEFDWVTPSGFCVKQKLMKHKVERIDLQLLGRCQMSIANGETDQVDKSRHKAATAPNLIHSLDACLLQLSLLRFNSPIATIHDSVLCRATDMSELSSVVRETYMHMFADNDYLKTFAQHIGAETEPPIIGDLNPESVIESTYFFS